MKYLFALLAGLVAHAAVACDTDLLDQDFRRLASEESVNLCEAYSGKVILVVNTASKCGNTPQYDGLEKLYSTYGEQGLVVLGFPSNDFMGQEPGTEAQIEEFCRTTYGVEFPMFEKISVTGEAANPFFVSLAEASGTYPTWNFHKFLIGRNGELITQFSPRTQPEDAQVITALEAALAN